MRVGLISPSGVACKMWAARGAAVAEWIMSGKLTCSGMFVRAGKA